MTQRRRTIDALVQDFADAVIARTAAIDHGTEKGAYTASKRVVGAWRAIWDTYGPEGLDAFAELLHHQDQDVRVDAAVYLADHRLDLALPVLQREAATNGGAQATLERLQAQGVKTPGSA